MRYKLVDEKPKTFVLVFERNDELADTLKTFASEQKLSDASFKAIGALSFAKLGWFNWESKKYEPSVVLNEQLELLSLIGDIASKDGKPQVHAHAIVGKRDGTAHGGHLLEARVRPTCEVVLTESSAHLKKEFDPEAASH
jgi:predicted DNA-binding protein with PD1-like motif